MSDILALVDNVNVVTETAEVDVLCSLANAYVKESLIIQEGVKDELSGFKLAKGQSSESILKRILLFIPRIIYILYRTIRRLFSRIRLFIVNSIVSKLSGDSAWNMYANLALYTWYAYSTEGSTIKVDQNIRDFNMAAASFARARHREPVWMDKDGNLHDGGEVYTVEAADTTKPLKPSIMNKFKNNQTVAKLSKVIESLSDDDKATFFSFIRNGVIQSTYDFVGLTEFFTRLYTPLKNCIESLNQLGQIFGTGLKPEGDNSKTIDSIFEKVDDAIAAQTTIFDEFKVRVEDSGAVFRKRRRALPIEDWEKQNNELSEIIQKTEDVIGSCTNLKELKNGIDTLENSESLSKKIDTLSKSIEKINVVTKVLVDFGNEYARLKNVIENIQKSYNEFKKDIGA